jgi:hypothetical protein
MDRRVDGCMEWWTGRLIVGSTPDVAGGAIKSDGRIFSNPRESGRGKPLQDLAESLASRASRQRLGLRLSSAALALVGE